MCSSRFLSPCVFQPYVPLLDIDIPFRLSLTLSLTSGSRRITLLLFLQIPVFSDVLSPHTAFHYIFLPVSLPDGSHLVGSSSCAHVSSVSRSHSIHGFPLFPCSGIPAPPVNLADPDSETDSAQALPALSGIFHSIGSVLLHLQSHLQHSDYSGRSPDTGIILLRRIP